MNLRVNIIYEDKEIQIFLNKNKNSKINSLYFFTYY